MQSKDIPTLPVLQFLSNQNRWCVIIDGQEHSVQKAMPAGTPLKLVRATMSKLIRQKLVDGCLCGCRGDFYLTPLGIQYLKDQSAPNAEALTAETSAS